MNLMQSLRSFTPGTRFATPGRGGGASLVDARPVLRPARRAAGRPDHRAGRRSSSPVTGFAARWVYTRGVSDAPPRRDPPGLDAVPGDGREAVPGVGAVDAAPGATVDVAGAAPGVGAAQGVNSGAAREAIPGANPGAAPGVTRDAGLVGAAFEASSFYCVHL